jgi:potassium-transporting ATPase ATP-binding subunit
MNVIADCSLRQTILRIGGTVFLAIRDSFAKLDPRVQFRNPVMFVVYLASIFLTILGIAGAFGAIRDVGHPAFILSVAAWLWLTMMFGNLAEAVAENRARGAPQGCG